MNCVLAELYCLLTVRTPTNRAVRMCECSYRYTAGLIQKGYDLIHNKNTAKFDEQWWNAEPFAR